MNSLSYPINNINYLAKFAILRSIKIENVTDCNWGGVYYASLNDIHDCFKKHTSRTLEMTWLMKQH